MMPAESLTKLPYLLDWRMSQGYSRAELARRAGVAIGTLRRAEFGGGVQGASIEKIARALGISRFQLVSTAPKVERPDQAGEDERRMRA